ncbi:MAG: hypothetical protein J6P28_03595 [Treponema sp.]|nr:hypothetical protein [Treponema sp.]
MEMKDLMNECETLIEENQKKKEIIKNSLKEFCDRCSANYKALFAPEYISLRRFTRRLLDVVPSAWAEWNVSDSNGKAFGNIEIHSDFATFRAFGYYDFYEALHEVEKEGVFIDAMTEMFSTPDSTLRTLSFFKAAFARILKVLARYVRDRNDELGETIERLASKSEESSCVKDNEDGSIEITINGKTYIGTVKEA